MSFFMCCLSATVFHPQGKNLGVPEFNAIGDMLASTSWELPQAMEYKNDLVQPQFLGVAGVEKAESDAIAVQSAKVDPLGPPSAEQWSKVHKMVA